MDQQTTDEGYVPPSVAASIALADQMEKEEQEKLIMGDGSNLGTTVGIPLSTITELHNNITDGNRHITGIQTLLGKHSGPLDDLDAESLYAMLEPVADALYQAMQLTTMEHNRLWMPREGHADQFVLRPGVLITE